ncbi:putative 50S ribosomal protein L30e [Rosa chinensis]|uniref:Putative 50S ribosomal protein L30e n=1 Tax=Rosa chinensis TaxID=74649 RepID=A0A2P6RF47_ROSCH|nr:uncharacterized protein LOC112192278 [Rosa chinensis]PRQ45035.1 putative 50S ribosomal protein L30e [Rosa chinensis]
MAPRKKHGNNNSVRPSKSGLHPQHQPQDCYEGERLDHLLQSIQRKIESARLMDNCLPEKIWFKLQFAVGVNDVTRVLERMKPVTSPMAAGLATECNPPAPPPKAKAASNELQAVLIAADSNPRWLTKHLPSLALSRNVPLIFLKDNKGASLRLGQLVKLKTAIAIGVKAKGNAINQLVDEILSGTGQGHLGTKCLD